MGNTRNLGDLLNTDSTIATADVADGGITTAKLADTAVTTAKITDANITTAKLASNAVTTAKITDGNISTAKLADDAVTGAKIENNPTIAGNLTVSGGFIPSINTSTSNILMNGNFAIAQRATSSTAQGIQSVDRWSVNFSQVSVTQSQQSTATSDAPYGQGLRNFFRAEITSASSSTASYIQFVHQVESQHIATSGWDYKSSSSYVTLSFWARSSLAGTYQAFLFTTNMSPNKIRTNTFTLSANTWTKISVSIQGDSSLTINNDVNRGMLVYIVPHYGTDFTGSNANTSTWYALTGQDYLVDYPQDWGNTNGRTFDITGCQLEVGQSATPYKSETYAENLHRCQRYFRQIGTIRKQGANGDPVGMTIPLEPTMRASPAVTGNSSTGGSHSIAGTGDFPNTQIIYSGTASTSGSTAFLQFTGVKADAEYD